MSFVHTVERGEGIARIAWINGFFPGRVWNHPNNAALREQRKHPEILQAGDRVFVPDNEPKKETGGTNLRHRFRMHEVPAKFQIRLLRDDAPRANLPYEFVIDDSRRITGKTDANGWVRESLMPDARMGRLIIDGGIEMYDVQFGHVDPIDSITGVQSRLRNLCLYSGEVDGQENQALFDAIEQFQQNRALPVTGAMSSATRDALQQQFGS